MINTDIPSWSDSFLVRYQLLLGQVSIGKGVWIFWYVAHGCIDRVGVFGRRRSTRRSRPEQSIPSRFHPTTPAYIFPRDFNKTASFLSEYFLALFFKLISGIKRVGALGFSREVTMSSCETASFDAFYRVFEGVFSCSADGHKLFTPGYISHPTPK